MGKADSSSAVAPGTTGKGRDAVAEAIADLKELVSPQATFKVFGVEFPVDAGDILASREYADRVVVVTRDGRKLEQPKRVAK